MPDTMTQEDLNGSDYFEDARFSRINLEEESFTDIAFHDCIFEKCTFRSVDFSACSFRDCRFIGCELTIVTLSNTVLGNTEFEDCKILGVNFTDCNSFSFSPDFFKTLLNNSVFYNLKMAKRRFRECSVFNCDFTETDLTQADFHKSEFRETMFQQCCLEKADFIDARGYTIDPVSNKIRGARFSHPDVMSFLAYLGIEIED